MNRTMADLLDLKLTLFLYWHELMGIDDYSCSYPSGTTIGKVWRRRMPFRCEVNHKHYPDCNEHTGHHVVGMYVEHEDPRLVKMLWFDVVLKHGPAPRNYHAPDWSNFAAWKAERALHHFPAHIPAGG